MNKTNNPAGRPKKVSKNYQVKTIDDLRKLIFVMIEDGMKQYKLLETSLHMYRPTEPESYLNPVTKERMTRRAKLRKKQRLTSAEIQVLMEAHKTVAMSTVALIDRACKLDRHELSMSESKTPSIADYTSRSEKKKSTNESGEDKVLNHLLSRVN